MDGDANVFSDALGFLVAAAIGFLGGRTRETGGEATTRAGIRDFVIMALLGGLSARAGSAALTATALLGCTAVLLARRFNAGQDAGITTELAALATFVLGYLCLTPHRPLAAALGVALALALATKKQLHRFALQTISEREFGDTLKFLALIFIIYPMLPEGGYGPYAFFEPRKVWLFIILVSGVSFVGYFLTKFFDRSKGLLLTAVVGGLASTTAYTGGVSKAVAENPAAAVSLARAALLANSIQYPRILFIIGITSPGLAVVALPSLLAMMVAGLVAAWALGRAGAAGNPGRMMESFRNPFRLAPALKFGAVFIAVLFLTRVGNESFGQSGAWITAALGGLIDVDAVLLSLVDFFNRGQSGAEQVIPGLLLAAATNSIFKSVLAVTSGQPAFYLRLVGGFLFMLGTGAAVWWGTLWAGLIGIRP